MPILGFKRPYELKTVECTHSLGRVGCYLNGPERFGGSVNPAGFMSAADFAQLARILLNMT